MIIAQNKRAKFDYDILKTYEAGIVLTGQEVKSVKSGHINLKGSYVTIKNNEAYLINTHIALYEKATSLESYDPYRTRKLLLRKQELKSLIGLLKQKGLTLVPIKVYTKRNLVKLEFGTGRGKKKIDKREVIKKREIDRRIRQVLKHTK